MSNPRQAVISYSTQAHMLSYTTFIDTHTDWKILEPIMRSEVLLCNMLASQVQSEHDNERHTCINPTSLETRQPPRRETPEVLPHDLLLIGRNSVHDLTTGALCKRIGIKEFWTYLVSVLPPDLCFVRDRVRTERLSHEVRSDPQRSVSRNTWGGP